MSTTLPALDDDARPRLIWLSRQLGFALGCEWVIALSATAGSIYLHVQNARWVGALWRDEAHSAAAAIRPSLGDLWNGLSIDNFPLLHAILLRAYGWTEWGRTDTGLRVLGATMGVAILAALWLNAWRINRAPPTVAIALWGFNAVAIRYGDGIRPYGLGILLQLLVGFAMGTLAIAPSWRRFAAASFVCVLAVQCLYQNAIFVLAYGLAGSAIALRHREYMRLVPVLCAGLVASLSLLPYLGPLASAQDWTDLMKFSLNWELALWVFRQVVGGEDARVLGILLLMGVAVVLVAVVRQVPHRTPLERNGADWALFALLSGIFSAAGVVVLSYATSLQLQAWHQLPVLAALVFSSDAIMGRPSWAAPLRTAALLAIVAFNGSSTIASLQVHLTNVEEIAKLLNESSASGDLIIVEPWFVGVTFDRYYHGHAEWTTLPELAEVRVHRYDLLKQSMQSPQAIDSVLRRAEAALRAGHRVWVAGFPSQLPHGAKFDPLPTAPPPRYGWQLWSYLSYWRGTTELALRQRATKKMSANFTEPQRYSPEEHLQLDVYSGYRR